MLTKPQYQRISQPIVTLTKLTELRPFAFIRVSHVPKNKINPTNSFVTQIDICSSCVCEHCKLPPEVLCLREIGCAWSVVPKGLLKIVSDELWKNFNFLVVAWIHRFLRSVNTWDWLRPILKEKGIEVWSAMEGIGSITHPDKFMAAVVQAEEEPNNKQRIRAQAMITRGLLHKAIEQSPTQSSDPWSKREDARLLSYIADIENLPIDYWYFDGNANVVRIRWTKLAESPLFPHRKMKQLYHRYFSLKTQKENYSKYLTKT
jgi:hypothetical protein